MESVVSYTFISRGAKSNIVDTTGGDNATIAAAAAFQNSNGAH